MLPLALALIVTAMFAYVLSTMFKSQRLVVFCEWLAAVAAGAAGLALVSGVWQYALSAL